jgi:hypothetical protein
MTDETRIGVHLPFNEGQPTGPDVDLLLELWPNPKVGERLEYEMIEELLRIDRRSNRFSTIRTKFKNRLKDSCGAVIECDPGKALYCASADQISAQTYTVLRHVGRKAKGHRHKLALAKTEDDLQRTTIEHQARIMVVVEREAKKHRQNLLPSTASAALPQITPLDKNKTRT